MIKKVNYKDNKAKTILELKEYDKVKVPQLKNNIEELSFVYQENGIILGRIVGTILWDHLNIEFFSVVDKARGQGIGAKLLSHVEEIAESKELKYIWLETMSFNAPRFYKNNGYKVFAKIINSPMPNTTRYFFKKDLL